MHRLRLLLPLLAAAAVAAVAVALANDDEGGQERSAQPTGSGGAAPRSATVPMENIEFQKDNVRIAVGGEVTWVNKDEANHTSTSNESATERGTRWDTGIIDPGASASVSFDEAGSFDYLCTVHPFMKATVTVVDDAG